MKGKGLTLELIVATATKLIEEKGYENFSLRELSARLNVKAASLYNHISSVDDINREVGLFAVNRMNEILSKAVGNKIRDEALSALADAYRQFAKDNQELYRTIFALPILDTGNGLRDIGKTNLDIIRKILEQYTLPDKTITNYMRSFRSALHGFVLLETAGYFTRMAVAADESYRFMITAAVEHIHNLEEQHNN
ncbi:MAG: TetR/AcrR family transcriptional regulator [Treponema sp.]|nr:TetR/AcrR family transcriptional regulator [Treponema sp.]